MSPPRGRPSGICSPVFLLMEGGPLGAGGVEKGGGRFAKLCRVLCVRTSRVGYSDVGGCGRLVRHSCSATAVTMCVNGQQNGLVLGSVQKKQASLHFHHVDLGRAAPHTRQQAVLGAVKAGRVGAGCRGKGGRRGGQSAGGWLGKCTLGHHLCTSCPKQAGGRSESAACGSAAHP